MKPAITPHQKKIYEKIIEEATVDCKDEYEQTAGWGYIFDENVHTPCNCIIGKEKAILEKIGPDDKSNVIVGVIKINRTKMRILIQDLVLEDAEAMKYINAYKYWCKNGS